MGARHQLCCFVQVGRHQDPSSLACIPWPNRHPSFYSPVEQSSLVSRGIRSGARRVALGPQSGTGFLDGFGRCELLSTLCFAPPSDIACWSRCTIASTWAIYRGVDQRDSRRRRVVLPLRTQPRHVVSSAGRVSGSGGSTRTSYCPSRVVEGTQSLGGPLAATALTRPSHAQTKIGELDAIIRTTKENLQADLRIAKHLAVLTPFRTSTRERILAALPPIEKRVRHHRMQ